MPEVSGLPLPLVHASRSASRDHRASRTPYCCHCLSAFIVLTALSDKFDGSYLILQRYTENRLTISSVMRKHIDTARAKRHKIWQSGSPGKPGTTRTRFEFIEFYNKKFLQCGHNPNNRSHLSVQKMVVAIKKRKNWVKSRT